MALGKKKKKNVLVWPLVMGQIEAAALGFDWKNPEAWFAAQEE